VWQPRQKKCVFSVAAIFIKKYYYHVFDYSLNVHYCLWDLWQPKATSSYFLCWVANLFINTVNRGAEEKEQEQSSERCTVESSSLSSPPVFIVSTASYCSFSSSFPSPSLSSSVFSTIHVNSKEQFTTGLRRFHRQSLLFLFPFSFSFAFCIVHCSWSDRVRPKPKCQVSGSDLVK